MRTVSLRRRVVGSALVIVAVLLLAVGVVVDLALSNKLHAEQEQRLRSLAVLAGQLDGTLGDQDLADRLTIPGVTAVITTGTTGSSPAAPVVGVPPAPKPGGHRPGPALPPASSAGSDQVAISVRSEGGRLVATRELDADRTLQLTADASTIETALSQFRLLMTIVSLAGLLIAGLVTWWVLGRALAPLDVLTRTARAISGGDRGRRLAADRADTELGRAASAFDAMLEELEGAERAAERAREQLRAFLSDASHELRTPLAGISAGAERILLGELDRDQRQGIAAAVVRDARRAARLVDDLLTVSRLDDPETRAVLEPIDPVDLVAAAAQRPPRVTSSAHVELDLPAHGSPCIRGDVMQIEQVLANLLDNARRALIDVPPAGDRRIRLRVTSGMRDGAEWVLIRVSDSGPGVPVADRERIFERLVRLDDARSRSTGGAGLGLPIARGLVTAHGGTLTCAEPSTGDLPGAVFEIALPAARALSPALSSNSGPA